MIRYALTCDAAHEFESWFRNSEDFDRLQAKDLLECPFCQTGKVRKAPMAPAIAKHPKFEPPTRSVDHGSPSGAEALAAGKFSGSRAPDPGLSDPLMADGTASAAPRVPRAVGPQAPKPGPADPGDRARDLAVLAQQIQMHIANSFDDVGRDFAKEARRRHAMALEDPLAPQRPIYGEASPGEAQSLREEGIGAYDLPDAFAPRRKTGLN